MNRTVRSATLISPDSKAHGAGPDRDRPAGLIDGHMDTAALLDLIDHGAPAGLPFIPPGAP